ncbi:MAG: hypothetical protein F4Z16_06475 [Rhodothermaceae bacterium]|nr:hypothetical protein [Rhodothermaceae bacterium]MYD66871.1 hypothetical protein [Rhodothermaceae bacterium]MYJ06455.1 hypothetical protein [Rhodothermaceae bacterium]
MARHSLALAATLLLWLIPCQDTATGQTESPSTPDITFNITVAHPDPSCTLSSASTLSFGTHTRQASGPDSETIDHSRGHGASLTLTGTDVSTYSVTATFPSAFPNLDVDLSLGWSEYDGDSWNSLSGTTYNGTAGGLWSDLTKHFRIGGTASWDWGDITSSGSDQATIDIRASCN